MQICRDSPEHQSSDCYLNWLAAANKHREFPAFFQLFSDWLWRRNCVEFTEAGKLQVYLL